VGGDPVNGIDPYGLQAYTGQTPPANIPGGPWSPNLDPNAKPGNFLEPKQPKGPRTQCQYVPDEQNGGTKGAKQGYWKTNSPSSRGWDHFDLNGNPITADQAHPGNGPQPKPVPEPVSPEPVSPPPLPDIPWWARVGGVGAAFLFYSAPAY
jgi:hypothetical protein